MLQISIDIDDDDGHFSHANNSNNIHTMSNDNSGCILHRPYNSYSLTRRDVKSKDHVVVLW